MFRIGELSKIEIEVGWHLCYICVCSVSLIITEVDRIVLLGFSHDTNPLPLNPKVDTPAYNYPWSFNFHFTTLFLAFYT